MWENKICDQCLFVVKELFDKELTLKTKLMLPKNAQLPGWAVCFSALLMTTFVIGENFNTL